MKFLQIKYGFSVFFSPFLNFCRILEIFSEFGRPPEKSIEILISSPIQSSEEKNNFEIPTNEIQYVWFYREKNSLLPNSIVLKIISFCDNWSEENFISFANTTQYNNESFLWDFFSLLKVVTSIGLFRFCEEFRCNLRFFDFIQKNAIFKG